MAVPTPNKFAEVANFHVPSDRSIQVGSVPTALAATCKATEMGGEVRRTLLKLTACQVSSVTVTTAVGFGGVKLYDWHPCRLWILGVTAYFDVITFGANILANGSGDYSLGTTITLDATLATTEVDLLPSSAMLDPFASSVGRSNVGTALAANVAFDGTSTAKDLNLNVLVDAAAQSDDTTAIVSFTGEILVTWMDLGDY
jgi:hypothetical protein